MTRVRTADPYSMRMPGRLILGAVALVALSASPAGAVATPVSPSRGASMTTTHPAFAWTLPVGEVVESISVARSNKISPNTNDFVLADLQDSAILQPGVSKWTPTRPVPAGTYYWHVASRSETVTHVFSQSSSFVIRPTVSMKSILVKVYAPQRTLLITTSWQANERKVDFVARLLSGRKVLGERKLATDNVLIDARKQDLSTWIIPPTVKKGARLRFVVKLETERGAKASKTKTLRAP